MEADRARSEAAQLSRDFEDARVQSLGALEEVTRERDLARFEAGKQEQVAVALATRVQSLSADLDVERQEGHLLRQTLELERQAVQSWKEKCKGTPSPSVFLLVLFLPS